MEKELALKDSVTLNVADIKKYICPSATDKELFMFLGIARSYGLNPLKREIHFVKYGNNPASIIVGYEVYLKRAEATGKLDGWKCWIEKDEIGEKAVIEIKRKDQDIPVRWEVYRKEFDRQQASWKTMPMFLLKKVAISQGFRLAFPGDLGGMPYTAEELPVGKGEAHPMPEVPVDVVEAEVPNGRRMATPEQVKRIQIMMRQEGVENRDEILELLSGYVERTLKSSKELTFDEAHQWIDEHVVPQEAVA
jgi:phage recombination protein Bet